MTVQREVVTTLVKAVPDPLAERRGASEEKLRAVEEWNNILLEKAERMDTYFYTPSNRESVLQRVCNPGVQLSLFSQAASLKTHEL